VTPQDDLKQNTEKELQYLIKQIFK